MAQKTKLAKSILTISQVSLTVQDDDIPVLALSGVSLIFKRRAIGGMATRLAPD
jgi:hypothetical protein